MCGLDARPVFPASFPPGIPMLRRMLRCAYFKFISGGIDLGIGRGKGSQKMRVAHFLREPIPLAGFVVVFTRLGWLPGAPHCTKKLSIG